MCWRPRSIPANRKRDEIYRQLAEFRSAERNVLSMEEWWGMAGHMGGVAAMGGPVMGPPLPASPPGHEPKPEPRHH